MTTLVAEQLFGISIIYLGITIFLFLNGILALLTYMKLNTDAELGRIKTDLNSIKAMENKEKNFFYANTKYIETEDAIAMGLKEVIFYGNSSLV